MKRLSYLYLFSFSVLTVSCSTILKNKKTSSQQTTKSTQPRFLGDIEVNPGEVVSSKEKSYGYKKHIEEKEVEEKVAIANDSDIENKYATLLGVSPQTVLNDPLIEKIDDWYGTPYLYGGDSKLGIDCSAFSRMLLNTVFNSDLPRTSREQYSVTERINKDELKEGDLVFFHTGRSKRVSHVGIYLQNNKFVHASTSSGVMISDLTEDYWRNHYKGAGRVK